MSSAAIYARISDDKSADSHGVQSQAAQCRNYAGERGWTIEREYIDNDLSAYSGVARPEFEQLIKDMSAGRVPRLIIWHVDRLCRRVSDLARVLQAARDGGTDIHTIKAGDIDLGNASGELMAYMLGAVAQFEARHISERVSASHTDRVAAGKWRGAGRVPFGYDSAGGGMLKVNEGEAARLREWAQRILDGDTLLAIKRSEAAKGHKLVTASIVNRLRNPNVAGLATYKGKITGPAVWPAILDEDTWRDVDAVLADPKRRTTQGGERKYQGSGIYRCSKCGGRMKSASGTHGGKRGGSNSGPSYCCRECYGIYRGLADVDALVDEVILGYLSKPENRLTVANAHADGGADVGELHAQRGRLMDRKARLSAMFAEGQIDDEQLVSGTKEIRAQLDKIEGKLDKARGDSPLMALTLDEGDLRQRWALLPPDKRAAIIDLLVTVTIHPARHRVPFDAEAIEVDWKLK